MLPVEDFSDVDIKKRHHTLYGKDCALVDGQIPYYREKWSSLSEFIREIKLSFTRFYNRRHNRRGYFWGDRFKSVVVENGDTLINCLAYIDFHPVKLLEGIQACFTHMFYKVKRTTISVSILPLPASNDLGGIKTA